MFRFAVVVLCVFGGALSEGPYPPSGWKPTGALLVLPSRQEQAAAPPNSYGPPPPQEYGPPQQQGQQDDEVNPSEIMEQLKKQEGSKSGEYHVFLPDGRLQKVQFTTAPLKKEQDQDKQKTQKDEKDSRFNGQQAASQQYQNGFLPQQYLPANGQQTAGNGQQSFAGSQQYQQSREQAQFQQSFAASQRYEGAERQQAGASQQSPATPLRVYSVRPAADTQFVPMQMVWTGAEQQRYRAQETKEADKDEATELVHQFGRTAGPPEGSYLASVQYTEVEPVSAPIYSYNTAPLVRILRSSK